MIPLIMSVLYVWAQFNKDTIVSFWFGTRFKVGGVSRTQSQQSVMKTINTNSVSPSGLLSTLGHPGLQLHYRRLVSEVLPVKCRMMCSSWITHSPPPNCLCRFMNELTGNLVGHLFFFLMFKYPMDLGGRSFLSTPEFL